MLGKSAYFFVLLRYGRSCQEMCGTILWVGNQDNSTTPQSIYYMHWWPSFQRRRIEICRRIVKSMLSNCSEMRWFRGDHDISCETQLHELVSLNTVAYLVSAVFILSLFSVCVLFSWQQFNCLYTYTCDRSQSWELTRTPWTAQDKNARRTLCSLSHMSHSRVCCGYGTRVRNQRVWKVVWQNRHCFRPAAVSGEIGRHQHPFRLGHVSHQWQCGARHDGD